MADDAPSVAIEHHGPVAVVRLNRPEKLNAFSRDMDARITEFLASLNGGTYETRAVILTGEGRAFCAGADVNNFPQADPGRVEPPFRFSHVEHTAPIMMRDCDVPVIGAINGYAIGMGFGLALATDLRIAAEDARFQVTQLHRGLMGDYGLGFLLPEALGKQRALELMVTGRWVDAAEALRLRLVLDVVPKERLLDRAMELAQAIARGPAIAIAASKRVVYMGDLDELRRSMDWTNLAIQRLFRTADNREGIRSFVERRDPVFEGR
jgi:enoyl-CoA hydratase/carnithine racemase